MCTMCLSEFEELLPCCNHVFHLDCINTWLTSHITCFIYRANLVKQVVDNNLDLLPIATPAIDVMGLQHEIVVLPHDHVPMVMDP